MRRLAAVLLACALLLSAQAVAQTTVLQGGPFTRGHAPMYAGQGSAQPVVQDSGAASGGGAGVGLSELLQVNRGTGSAPYANTGSGPLSTHTCLYDGPTTGANHYLCLDADAQGGGLLAYGAQGGATPLPFNMNVNGVSLEFPFNSASGAWTIPGSLSVGSVGSYPVVGSNPAYGNGGSLVLNTDGAYTRFLDNQKSVYIQAGGGQCAAGTESAWSSSTIYAQGNVVSYSGSYYISSLSGNVGNTPVSGGSQFWFGPLVTCGTNGTNAFRRDAQLVVTLPYFGSGAQSGPLLGSTAADAGTGYNSGNVHCASYGNPWGQITDSGITCVNGTFSAKGSVTAGSNFAHTITIGGSNGNPAITTSGGNLGITPTIAAAAGIAATGSVQTIANSGALDYVNGVRLLSFGPTSATFNPIIVSQFSSDASGNHTFTLLDTGGNTHLGADNGTFTTLDDPTIKLTNISVTPTGKQPLCIDTSTRQLYYGTAGGC